MANFAAASKANTAGFPNGIGWEVVVQQEVLIVAALQRINQLLVIASTQSTDR